jgi:hypothetical protein
MSDSTDPPAAQIHRSEAAFIKLVWPQLSGSARRRARDVRCDDPELRNLIDLVVAISDAVVFADHVRRQQRVRRR